jgi:hypothetical protein
MSRSFMAVNLPPGSEQVVVAIYVFCTSFVTYVLVKGWNARRLFYKLR